MSRRQSTDEISLAGNDDSGNSVDQKRQKADKTRPPTGDGLASRLSKPGFTFRISKVSMAISRDQLFEILNSLPSDTQPNEKNVLGLSLTPSAVFTDASAESAQVATVTFKSTPHDFRSTPISLSLDALGVVALDYNFYGMTPLSNPAEPVVDIIAITGLAGHGFGSWKSRTAHTMWLRDLLPVHVTNARILTYGYDSTLFGNESYASIHEFSQLFLQALATIRTSEKEQSRPIIFIAHSLGGLVIKYVLCNHPSLLASCHGLVLFGVPHLGLKVEALRSMVRGQPNAKLLEDLNEGSSFLSLLELSWKSHRIVGIKVISIYEGKPTAAVQKTPEGWKRTGPKDLMVTQYSATAASVDSGDSFSIDRNHSDIVKFENEVCQYYEIIKLRIGDLVKDVQDGPWVKLKKNERRDVLRWLLTVKFEDHHVFNSNRRQQGSGTWLLENEMWNRWATGNESSILWLRGDAGSGKTMLASFVIDTLKVEAKSDDHILAYFYCHYKDPDRRDPIPILNTIIKHFCLKKPAREGKCPRLCWRNTKKRADNGHSSGTLNTNECKDLLLALSNHYLKTTIIIDALDECNQNTRFGLFDALKFIVSMSRSKVKIFITSRYHDDIERAFRGTIHYYLCADDNQHDIDRFIEEEVNRRCDRQRPGDTDSPLFSGKIFQTELKAEIISVLKSRSCGMFLWAQLQILALCHPRTNSDIRETLRVVPKTLCNTYRRMLHAENNAQSRSHQLHMHRLLKFLMSAERKCSEKLILQALAIQCGKHTVDEEILSFERSDILTICQNLVVYNDGLKCVEFAHFSVKEFLLEEEGFSEVSCHNLMAAVCLTALLFHSRSEKMKDIVHYATINWSIHIKRAGPLSEDVSTQLKQFLTVSDPYKDWLHRIGSHDMKVKGPRGQVLSPFWVACYYDLIAIARVILQEVVDVNAVNEEGETALFSSIERGEAATAELLLACKTVNLKLVDGMGRTPLLMAVECKFGALATYPSRLSRQSSKARGEPTLIIKLLLACGKVDVNQEDSNGQTLLFRAVEQCKAEVVKLLLECDRVDVNHVDERGQTALLMAVENLKAIDIGGVSQSRYKLLESETKPIVQLLLVCGRVDVNQADRNGQTLLLRAVELRNTGLVELLLECGRIDVNQIGGEGETPLTLAISRGGRRLTQFLLEEGGVGVSGEDISRLFSAVSLTGSFEMIERLEGYSVQIIKMLLAVEQIEQIDVSCTDREGRGPLLIATKVLLNIGKQDVLKTPCQLPDWGRYHLLSRPRGWYETQRWEYGKSPDRSEILDPSVTDVQHLTIHPYWEVIKLLLKFPTIDPNSKDPDGKTSLIHAAMDPLGVNLMRMLLRDRRVHVNCQDVLGRTPLSYAAQRGNIQAVMLLLASDGFDTNIPDKCGRTPLRYATERGEESVVKLLLASQGIGNSEWTPPRYSEYGVRGTSDLIYRPKGPAPDDTSANYVRLLQPGIPKPFSPFSSFRRPPNYYHNPVPLSMTQTPFTSDDEILNPGQIIPRY